MNFFIDQETFRESYYSIGSGFNLQPLLRFSHLTNDFIYTNLFISKDSMFKWYFDAIQKNDELELLEFEIIDDLKLGLHVQVPTSRYCKAPRFMTESEKRDYQNTFIRNKKDQYFGLHFRVLRKSNGKILNLFILESEGFATLLALSNGGEKMPKILENIQVGPIVDNGENGLIARLLDSKRTFYPLLWIRGHMDGYPDFSFNSYSNNSLKCSGPRSVVGLNLNGKWKVGNFNNPNSKNLEDRYVNGFISKELNNQLKEKFSKPFEIAENIEIVPGDIQYPIQNQSLRQILVISSCIAKKYEFTNFENILNYDIAPIEIPEIDYKTASIEDFAMGGKYDPFIKEESIEKFQDIKDNITKFFIKNSIDETCEIHLIPFVKEDELSDLIEFLKGFKSCFKIYIKRNFDLIQFTTYNHETIR